MGGEGLGSLFGESITRLQDIVDKLGVPVDVIFPCEQNISTDIGGWVHSGDAGVPVVENSIRVIGGNSMKVPITIGTGTATIIQSTPVDILKYREGFISFVLRTTLANDLQSGDVIVTLSDGTGTLTYNIDVSRLRDATWTVMYLPIVAPTTGDVSTFNFDSITSVKIDFDTSGASSNFDLWVDYISAGGFGFVELLTALAGGATMEALISVVRENFDELFEKLRMEIIYTFENDVAGDIADWIIDDLIFTSLARDTSQSFFGGACLTGDMSGAANREGWIWADLSANPRDYSKYSTGRIGFFCKITQFLLSELRLEIYDATHTLQYDIIDQMSGVTPAGFLTGFDDGWRFVEIDLEHPTGGDSYSDFDWSDFQGVGIYAKNTGFASTAKSISLDYMFITDNRLEGITLQQQLRMRIQDLRTEMYDRFFDLYQRNRNGMLLPCESNNIRDIGNIVDSGDVTTSLNSGNSVIGVNCLEAALVNGVGSGDFTKNITVAGLWNSDAFINGQIIFFIKVPDWSQIPVNGVEFRIVDDAGNYLGYYVNPASLIAFNNTWKVVILNIQSYDTSSGGFDMTAWQNIQILIDTSSLLGPMSIYFDFIMVRDKVIPDTTFLMNIQERLWDNTNSRPLLDSIIRLLDGTDPGELGTNIREVAGTPQTGRDWSADFAYLQNIDEFISNIRKLLDNTTIGALFNGTRSIIDVLDGAYTPSQNVLNSRLKDSSGNLITDDNPLPSRERSDFVRYTAYGVIDDSFGSDSWIAIEFDTDGVPNQYVETDDGKGTSVFTARVMSGTLRDFFELVEVKIRQTGTLRGASIEPRTYMQGASAFKAYDLFSELFSVFSEDWIYHPIRSDTFYKKFQLYVQNDSVVSGQNISFELEILLKNIT